MKRLLGIPLIAVVLLVIAANTANACFCGAARYCCCQRACCCASECTECPQQCYTVMKSC
jgi:hypothetical protein